MNISHTIFAYKDYPQSILTQEIMSKIALTEVKKLTSLEDFNYVLNYAQDAHDGVLLQTLASNNPTSRGQALSFLADVSRCLREKYNVSFLIYRVSSKRY